MLMLHMRDFLKYNHTAYIIYFITTKQIDLKWKTDVCSGSRIIWVGKNLSDFETIDSVLKMFLHILGL